MLTVMGLIHDAEYDSTIALIMIGNGSPDCSKLIICRATLADNSAIKTSVGVQVNNAMSSSVQASVHEQIELCKVGGV